VVVVAAGAAETEEARSFISRDEVDYLGVISNEESIATCYRVTAMLTYYDPAVEINLIAEPNKWGDCLSTATPFICNQEILTSVRYVDSGLCYRCPYDDVIALAETICVIARSHRFTPKEDLCEGSKGEGWEALIHRALVESRLL
tara:strand:+ start:8193 stop:8627 length:435 start_codon:yes stop_codon:yes gene_type:complete